MGACCIALQCFSFSAHLLSLLQYKWNRNTRQKPVRLQVIYPFFLWSFILVGWDQHGSTLTRSPLWACSREPELAVSYEPGPDHNHGQKPSEIWEDVWTILMTDSAVGKIKVLLGSQACMWKPTLALSNKEIKQNRQFSFAPPRETWSVLLPVRWSCCWAGILAWAMKR